MKLRHFLYGKGTSTDDFLTLVKSSGMTEAELKFWEARIGALVRELREHGVPGNFMRLFISGRSASQWAYARVRTGGDRARFDFQAVMLTSEELDWLGWQPWGLDSALFSNNTYDQRVQDAMKRTSAAQSSREYNPPVVDIEFNEREIKPLRITARQEEIVDRILTGLGDTNAPDTRWYFDAGRNDEEEARHIIAGVLNRRRSVGQQVPGFVMGLTSVRGNGTSIGATYQNDDRFADIRLASYRKDPDGSFPFESWRDAEVEQSPMPLMENLPSNAPDFRGGQPDSGIPQTRRVEPDRAQLDRNDVRPEPPAWMALENGSGIIADTPPVHSPLPAPVFDESDHDRPSSHISEQIRDGLDRPVPLKFALAASLAILILSSAAAAYIGIRRGEQRYSNSEKEFVNKRPVQEPENKSQTSSSNPPVAATDTTPQRQDMSAEVERDRRIIAEAKVKDLMTQIDEKAKTIDGLNKRINQLTAQVATLKKRPPTADPETPINGEKPGDPKESAPSTPQTSTGDKNRDQVTTGHP